MLNYLVRRLLTMIPTLLIISLLVFVIIQLPPGDYIESHIAELQSQGESVDEQKASGVGCYRTQKDLAPHAGHTSGADIQHRNNQWRTTPGSRQ